jgi:hypothetical protein
MAVVGLAQYNNAHIRLRFQQTIRLDRCHFVHNSVSGYRPVDKL